MPELPRLTEGSLPEGPFELFAAWLGDAEASGMTDPNAMPRLTEPAYPKGLPKAMTVSPSKRSSSLANLTAGNFRPGDLSLSKATSLAALSATRSASIGSDPSLNFTNTRFTPSTTWTLVST